MDSRTEEIKAVLKFMDLVGREKIAEFIVNQNSTIKGQVENIESYTEGYRKLLDADSAQSKRVGELEEENNKMRECLSSIITELSAIT